MMDSNSNLPSEKIQPTTNEAPKPSPRASAPRPNRASRRRVARALKRWQSLAKRAITIYFLHHGTELPDLPERRHRIARLNGKGFITKEQAAALRTYWGIKS